MSVCLALWEFAAVLQGQKNCNYYDRSSIAERETAITKTLPAWQREKPRALRGTPKPGDLEDLKSHAFLNKLPNFEGTIVLLYYDDRHPLNNLSNPAWA